MKELILMRKELGLSQQELASKARLSIRAIANYEAGRLPDLAAMFKLFAVAHAGGLEWHEEFWRKLIICKIGTDLWDTFRAADSRTGRTPAVRIKQ